MNKWNSIIKLCYIPNLTLGNGNTIKFKTLEEELAFFETYKVKEFNNISYIREQGGSITIPINASEFSKLSPNYLLFKNTDFSDKWYIANITNYLYISPKVTEISYSLDSFLTYQHDIRINKSYTVRRTWSGENSNEIINLPLEDLDCGAEYMITDYVEDDNGSNENYKTGQFFYILLTKPLIKNKNTHNIITGDVKLPDGKGGYKTINNGQNVVLYGYIMNYTCLNSSINKGLFLEDCDLVNALQLIIQLPFGRELFPATLNNIYKEISTKTNPTFGESLPTNSECYEQTNFGFLHKNKNIKGLFNNLCNIINKVSKQVEKGKPKTALGQYLLRYPYSLLQVYDFYNQPDTIKLDSISRNNNINSEYDFINNGLNIHKYGSIGQTPTLAYSIGNYLNNSFIDNYNLATEQGGLTALKSPNMYTIQSTNNLPIINDYLSTFLQANQNQINAQRMNLRDTLQTQINNAGASIQAQATSIALNRAASEYAATQANITSMANRLTSYTSSMAQNNISTAAKNRSAIIEGGLGIGAGVGRVAGGAFTTDGTMVAGGAGEILNSVGGTVSKLGMIQADHINSIIATNANDMIAGTTASGAYATALNTAASIAEANNAQSQAAYGNSIRNANTSYNNEIRALNARTQDARNIPPTLQTMGNNSSLFNILNNRDTIIFTTKTLPESVLERLANFFILNGFLTNKLENTEEIINKLVDKGGLFIQTVNAKVEGQIPTESLMQIRTMLDGGVFIWNKDSYLNYDVIYKM